MACCAVARVVSEPDPPPVGSRRPADLVGTVAACRNRRIGERAASFWREKVSSVSQLINIEGVELSLAERLLLVVRVLGEK